MKKIVIKMKWNLEDLLAKVVIIVSLYMFVQSITVELDSLVQVVSGGTFLFGLDMWYAAKWSEKNENK